jgi:hypothetical protein
MEQLLFQIKLPEEFMPLDKINGNSIEKKIQVSRSSPIFCVKFPLARIRCFYHHRLAYCTALGPWGQGRAKPGDNVSLTPGPPAVIKSYRW